MSKYDPLLQALLAREGSSWRVRFDQVEKILGIDLPASARKYPAWWSNDHKSHSHTRAWLRAGWKTEQVDIPGEALTFRKIADTGVRGHGGPTGSPAPVRATAVAGDDTSLHLSAVPQSVMAVLARRAAAGGTSLQSEAITLLVKAVEKSDRMTQASSIRAMTPKGQNFDLAALIRQERNAR